MARCLFRWLCRLKGLTNFSFEELGLFSSETVVDIETQPFLKGLSCFQHLKKEIKRFLLQNYLVFYLCLHNELHLPFFIFRSSSSLFSLRLSCKSSKLNQ